MAEEPRCVAEIAIPLHVTGLWLPVKRGSPLETGSLGAGLLLEPPVVARVRRCGPRARCGLVLHGPGVRGLPGVVAEVYRLDPGLAMAGSVEASLPVPLGVGYAASAAAALAAAVGLGTARGGATVEQLARIAHIAEVAAGTGLGDVVAMLYGRMLELRTAAGGPGLARVESIPVPPGLWAVSLKIGEPMETREMHRSLGRRLYGLAAPRLARLFEEPRLEVFLEEARMFSIEAGFAPEPLRGLLDEAVETGLAAGWYAKKRVAVLVSPGLRRARELLGELRRRGFSARLHRVAGAPLRLTPCGEEDEGPGGEAAELPAGEAGKQPQGDS